MASDSTSARRFFAPWRSEKIRALAYVYARAMMAEAVQAKTLTQDEARRIAANIARLPALLRAGKRSRADRRIS
jgi:hypothetical protein